MAVRTAVSTFVEPTTNQRRVLEKVYRHTHTIDTHNCLLRRACTLLSCNCSIRLFCRTLLVSLADIKILGIRSLLRGAIECPPEWTSPVYHVGETIDVLLNAKMENAVLSALPSATLHRRVRPPTVQPCRADTHPARDALHSTLIESVSIGMSSFLEDQL